MKKIISAFLLALILTSLAGIAKIDATCNEIEDDVLRLHVLANSDSEEDQALKLKVRDAILKEGADIFKGAKNANAAREKIRLNSERLKDIAEKEIKNQGYNYEVEIKICEEYFETRTYNDITLPAGKYNAVKVLIGEGKGKNWWCVMFPPLCLPAAEKEVNLDVLLSKDEMNFIKNTGEYEIRFKVVEIYEQFKNKSKFTILQK